MEGDVKVVREVANHIKFQEQAIGEYRAAYDRLPLFDRELRVLESYLPDVKAHEDSAAAERACEERRYILIVLCASANMPAPGYNTRKPLDRVVNECK